MMKRKINLVATLVMLSVGLWAQQEGNLGVTQCGTPSGQPKFPLENYRELPDPKIPAVESWLSTTTPKVSWGSTDIRYAKHEVPMTKLQNEMVLQGWRGERVNAQAVVWTGTDLNNLNISFSVFKNKKGDALSPDALQVNFVRYVMTDGVKGGCESRKHAEIDSLLVADPIDHLLRTATLPAHTVQPVWVQCYIPASAVPGVYDGELLVKNGECLLQKLRLEIQVSSRQLPPPAEWNYHLDLWQNPFAVARYHQVPLWSKEHFDAMRPVMKLLADAGQKVITASIIHKPWNGQTEDYFETMVTWMKRADGTWTFDYTVFDRWVEFMMSVGIDKQISCYSMVPWKLSFRYLDQATDSMQTIQTEPGTEEYNEMWGQMLVSFSKHLREKGWFQKCMIAMDERPEKVMKAAMEVIHRADPEFKISLAGHFHSAIEQSIDDYCVSVGVDYPAEVIVSRKLQNKTTTYYTSCTEDIPNLYTLSNPAEPAWLSYYVAKKHLDGYLRWAYNSWTLEPLLDSRFRTWSGGDTYQVYPGGRTSIRFERLLEGIQAHEKITILRREFKATNNTSGLKKIEKMLSPFVIEGLTESSIPSTIRTANQMLNSL